MLACSTGLLTVLTAGEVDEMYGSSSNWSCPSWILAPKSITQSDTSVSVSASVSIPVASLPTFKRHPESVTGLSSHPGSLEAHLLTIPPINRCECLHPSGGLAGTDGNRLDDTLRSLFALCEYRQISSEVELCPASKLAEDTSSGELNLWPCAP
ncbi:unnamed protein product [Protopolystoma xenopodis]|uniref:Uncharacterized protein n=1 Tax=Protopolystoma xenopodis TaxID=117903 RepID=A0A3S5BTM4_9PLAT|nr:unnamed protein product [Protopolystoma xenopodis]